MSVLIEALYIFDDKKNCLLEHVYRARPPKPKDLISRYNNLLSPLPAIVRISDLNPPTTVYSIRHGALLVQCVSSVEVNALATLEFLRRVVDIFEDFLGSPLLPHKIEENYEIIAQLLSEVCDGGVVCNTEPNAMRENVEVSTRLGKLFETVGLQGPSAAPGSTNLAAVLKANSSSSGPAIPWRRSNVRHTSNELYVDIIESLSVVFAPSGRPIQARSTGSIAFTSKISGIPDLLLQVNAPGGSSLAKSSGIARTMQLPVFHPCVRLSRWKENPGEMSFIPPDGKFMLAGYEVDLLPYSFDTPQLPSHTERLFLPATVDLRSGLGPSGSDFEARLTLNTNFPGVVGPKTTLGPGKAPSTTPFSFGSASSGSSTAPALEAVVVTIPFPPGVRNVADFKPSRGDAVFNLSTKIIEWRVPTKDGFTIDGTATLRGSIMGAVANNNEYDDEDNLDEADDNIDDGDDDDYNEDEITTFGTKSKSKSRSKSKSKSKSLSNYYNEESTQTQNKTKTKAPNPNTNSNTNTNTNSNNRLSPQSISVSFTVKGWLPSGIKVESLTIDTKKSRGLGEGVKPYKGVKYLTVSRRGVERRL